MSVLISDPAKCEVRAVIRFLHAKNMKAAEIHRELCEVYGPNIMSERVVRLWCNMFENGRTNVHDEIRTGRPSVVTKELVQEVEDKIKTKKHFTITELSNHFPQISRTVLYEIVTQRLDYQD